MRNIELANFFRDPLIVIQVKSVTLWWHCSAGTTLRPVFLNEKQNSTTGN